MQKIYEALVGLCPTFTLPGPWQSLACDPAFFCLPEDQAAVLATLRQQFADADLIQSGVAITDETNSLIWQPTLVVAGAPIWAIRRKPKEKPAGLIAQMRTIGKSAWPFGLAFEDHRQNERIAALRNQMVVAYSMTDLAILQSLGIAAVPGGEWGRFTKQQLDYLRKKLRMTTQTPEASTNAEKWFAAAGRESISLILANWSLATLELTDIAAATTSWAHLRELDRFLQLDLSSFGLWKPSSTNLQTLDFQLQYLTVQQLRETIWHGIRKDALTIGAQHFVKTPPIRTFGEAYRAWQQAERSTLNPTGAQQAYELLCELQDRQRFEPLVTEAMQTADPVERNALFALAETSRLMQPLIFQLTEKLRHNIGEQGTRVGNFLSKEEMTSALALFGRMSDLTKGVLKCRRHNPTKKAHPKAAPPRSTPSTSTPPNSPP